MRSDSARLQVRYATETDAPCVLEMFRALSEQDASDETLWSDIEGSTVIILERDGVTAGQVMLKQVFHGGTVALMVFGLYVKPEHRGRSSFLLVQAAVAEARKRGVTELLYHLDPSNDPGLYKRLGGKLISNVYSYEVTQ